jgi:hypothetical protein
LTLKALDSESKRWLATGIALLLCLWLGGGLLLLNRAETALERAARSVLRGASARFDTVEVEFRGQTAILSAPTRNNDPALLAAAREVVKERVRLTKSWVNSYNPVADVQLTKRQTDLAAADKLPGTNGTHATSGGGQTNGASARALPSWLMIRVSPASVRLSGLLGSVSESNLLQTTVTRWWPQSKIENGIQTNDQRVLLHNLPDLLKDLGRHADGFKGSVLLSLTSKSEWMELPTNADDLAIAQSLSSAQVTMQEITSLAADWATVRPVPAAEPNILPQAQPVSPLAAAARLEAKPQAPEPPRLSQTPVASRPVDTKPVPKARRVGPSYIGWAVSAEEARLFGAVVTESEKVRLLESAERLFGSRIVHSAMLKTDPSRLPINGVKLSLPTKLPSSPIGFASAGKPTSLYPVDVLDRRIMDEYGSIGVQPEEVAEWLQPFRARHLASGKLKPSEPFVCIISNGTTTTIVGEVGSASAKQAMLQHVAKFAPHSALEDAIKLSTMVRDDPALLAILQRVPPLEAGEPVVFVLRPGQVARRGVAYSIYFSGGMEPTQDLERAVVAVQHVCRLLPQAHLEIVGHTDNKGSVSANDQLGLARAALCAEALIKEVPLAPELIPARSAGPREPIAENSTETGRAINRRVDIRILSYHE